MRAISLGKELFDVNVNGETLLHMAQESLADYLAREGRANKLYEFGIMVDILYDLREPWDEFFDSFFQ